MATRATQLFQRLLKKDDDGPQQKTTFLSLPLEIRQIIYHHCLCSGLVYLSSRWDPTPARPFHRKPKPPNFERARIHGRFAHFARRHGWLSHKQFRGGPQRHRDYRAAPGILRASRQIHDEAVPVMLGAATFVFDSTFTAARFFAHNAAGARLAAVRRVAIKTWQGDDGSAERVMRAVARAGNLEELTIPVGLAGAVEGLEFLRPEDDRREECVRRFLPALEAYLDERGRLDGVVGPGEGRVGDGLDHLFGLLRAGLDRFACQYSESGRCVPWVPFMPWINEMDDFENEVRRAIGMSLYKVGSNGE